MSLVSVIIPVYNRLEYISEAIESVLAQTYKDYEIIIVNDGSSVNVEKVLSPYRNTVKYFHQNHLGTAAARNNGINHSSGEYIAFLDDDDLFESEKLEKQVKKLEADPNLGFVFSDFYYFETKNPERKKIHSTKLSNVSRDEFANSYFIHHDLAVSSFLVRRKSIESIGLFDHNFDVNEDVDLWMRLFLNDQGEYSNYPSTKIRVDGPRVSKNRIFINRNLIENLKKILDNNPEFAKKLGTAADKKIIKLHYLLGRALFENHEIYLAQKEFVFCAKSYHLMIKRVYLFIFLCVLGKTPANVVLKFWRFLWNHFFGKLKLPYRSRH